jgi:hypothetical protein
VERSCSEAVRRPLPLSLAGHYGLTEEELDFIVNYDVKCRMGDELAMG